MAALSKPGISERMQRTQGHIKREEGAHYGLQFWFEDCEWGDKQVGGFVGGERGVDEGDGGEG